MNENAFYFLLFFYHRLAIFTKICISTGCESLSVCVPEALTYFNLANITKCSGATKREVLAARHGRQ